MSKLRFSGLGWLTSSTLAWSVVRRGTMWSNWILNVPIVLVVSQFFMVAFELLTPLMFALRDRWRYRVVAVMFGFHVMTYFALEISFLPHVVTLLAFLPLERVRPVVAARTALSRLRPSERQIDQHSEMV